jgi:hypothetical protein
MSAVDDVGVAAARKLRAQNELEAASADLAVALVDLHQETRTPKCRIGAIVRDYLLCHGFDSQMIHRLALSDGSVRNALDKGKPPHRS